MSRRRAATGLVVAVALWPLVTLGLQQRFQVDPWKLLSFGMYATPLRTGAELELELLEPLPAGQAGQVTVLEGRAWVRRAPRSTAELQAAVEFVRLRKVLGALVRPDALVAEVRRSDGATDVAVVVRTEFLDPKTARLARRSEEYVDRAGGP